MPRPPRHARLPRPAFALAASLIALAVAVPAPTQETPPGASSDAAAVARPRVVVRVSRSREVPGYLELQDDELIVLRRLDGELESFTKTRILVVVHLVDPLPGQQGVVVLRNGQVSRGEVLRDAFDVVEVRVQGIPVEFRREDVDYVVLEPTFEQQFAQFKAQLEPSQVSAHMELCRWLHAQRRYVLARKELDTLIQRHPESADARNLLRLVQAQIELESGTLKPRDVKRPQGQPGPDDPRRGPVRAGDILPDRILSHDDVNLIRVYEIDISRPPAVAVSSDTIRTMLERHGSSKLVPRSADQRNALFRADPIEIVRLLFALRARDLYPQIKVLSEPYALNLFRRRVHNTWLMNGCATSRCHGGPFAGRFVLHRKGHKDARVWLTNLMILERLELDPAWPLVNYGAPLDSLIIQHGLPRHLARRPHPEVRGWSPAFTEANERMLEQTVEWIRLMMQPRPDYPIDYEPPRIGETRAEGAEDDPLTGTGPDRSDR